MCSMSWQLTFMVIPSFLANSFRPPRCARRLKHLPQRLFRLKKRVLGDGLRNMQHRGNFGVREPLDFIQEEDLTLPVGEPGQRALERQSQSGMPGGPSRLR